MLAWIAGTILSGLLAAGASPGHFGGQVLLPRDRVANQAVVVLEGGAKASPLPKAVIDQRDKMFSPHVSVVTVGTKISFPNNDTVFHNVYAYFDAKKFDLGVYPRGATKTITFDKKGVVALLCNVHSEMSAYIYITDSPYYAVTDRQGHFDISNVPPGTYTLHVWHESGAALMQTITVKADGGANTLRTVRK